MGENKRYNIGLWLAEPWKKRPTVCVMLTEKVSNSPFYLFLHTPIFSCQWLWVNVIIKNFNINNCIITDSYKKKKKKNTIFPVGNRTQGLLHTRQRVLPLDHDLSWDLQSKIRYIGWLLVQGEQVMCSYWFEYDRR